VRLRKQRQDRVHAVCGKMTSGQLPFSGSMRSKGWSAHAADD